MKPNPISRPAADLRRRDLLNRLSLGAGALGLAGAPARLSAAAAAAPKLPPVLMKAGHQHDHSDPTLRARMGASGRAAALTRFAWAGEAARLLSLYRDLIPTSRA